MSRSVPWALVGRSGAGAVLGASIALIVGLFAVALAPDNGFADLAAAALTKVVLVPFGAVVGGIAGYRFGG
jgi:hypothetical protein